LITWWLAAPAWAIEPKPVFFETFDGVGIHADYYEPQPASDGAPMAILLHMYRSDRAAWKPLAGPLHDAGFAVLAIDMRGHGESVTPELRRRVERRDPKLFEDVYQDVRAAYDWLAQQEGVDRSRFALVGASVGCSISLHYAVQDRSVDAVVCMTPGLDYLGLDSRPDMKQIRGRAILMLATEDEGKAAKTLATMAEGATARVVAEGKVHGTAMFGKVPGIAKEIAAFLREAVGEPTKTTVYGSINSNIWHPGNSGWIERITPSNMRHYSSPEEAEARGLRKTRSMGPRDRPGKRKPEETPDDNP
jgi:pimeloyl-ACP methyl ester carboxylesterase